MKCHDRPEFEDFPHCSAVIAAAADLCSVRPEDIRNTRVRLRGVSTARQAAMRFYREAYPGQFTTADVARFFGCTKDTAYRACLTDRPDVLAVVDDLLKMDSLRCPPPDPF